MKISLTQLFWGKKSKITLQAAVTDNKETSQLYYFPCLVQGLLRVGTSSWDLLVFDFSALWNPRVFVSVFLHQLEKTSPNWSRLSLPAPPSQILLGPGSRRTRPGTAPWNLSLKHRALAGSLLVLVFVCCVIAYLTTRRGRKEQAPSGDWGFFDSGDKDDDDDDDADEKMQSSGIPNGGHIRQESQEQSEVDHGDFEMVVSLWQQERGGGASELSSSSYSVYFHKLPFTTGH